MSFLYNALLSLSVVGGVLSAPFTSAGSAINPFIFPDEPADVSSTACGDIIVAKEQGQKIFWALDAWECLKDVPFNAAVGTRFVKYYNQTLQFQSTLELLKNPPAGYQQPPVDVVREFNQIQGKIDAGLYQNQYVFESDIQILINRFHDAHVYLNAGIMAPFTFASPYGLVSASLDGKAPPAIYIRDHIIDSHKEGWTPSPVTQINGVDVIEYLTAFAELNSDGFLEPHADWNALLESPSLDISGTTSVLQSATFYPGDELNFTLENGGNRSELNTYWLALFDEPFPTGPLTTAGDYYNYFVLGYTPASFDPMNPGAQWWPDPEVPDTPTNTSQTDDTAEEPDNPDYGCNDGKPASQNWCQESYGAFPNDPVIAQEHLSTVAGGVVTGYILEDISTGVLSIPSFWQAGKDTGNFFEAVDQFINITTENKIEKLIIDLTQNRGGLTLLALSVFKRFFYGKNPYTGSRHRSHELANTLGNSYSGWWDSLETKEDGAKNPLYKALAGSEWVVTNRLNEQKDLSNFTSWSEYSDNSRQHSLVQRYNLSDMVFDSSAFQHYIPYGYGISADDTATKRAWLPENIVLLTDGLCSSACAYFAELMTNQGGVRTVVVGGQPKTGPMQTASGNRGARLYSAEAIDVDIVNVDSVVEDKDAFAKLPLRNDTGMWINFAGFNIRDQFRKGDPTPLQFQYDAADCRIYWTLASVHNMTQLWRDAAAATWTDPSLCVEDSTGYAKKRGGDNSTEPKAPPTRSSKLPFHDLGFVKPVFVPVNSTVDLINAPNHISITAQNLRQCPTNGPCGGNAACVKLDVVCDDGSNAKKQLSACLAPCSSLNPICSGEMECYLDTWTTSKRQLPPKKDAHGKQIPGGTKVERYQTGYCQPAYVDTYKFPSLGCPI